MSQFYDKISLKLFGILILVTDYILGQQCGLSSDVVRTTGFVQGVKTTVSKASARNLTQGNA